MESVKPIYEFKPPKKGEMVWVWASAYTYSSSEPSFTPYYFDFVSTNGNLCFQKISTDTAGRRYAFDPTVKTAFDQTHLVVKPDRIDYLRVCRTAEEAYAIEMAYFAGKIASLNAAMLREMIPPLKTVKPAPAPVPDPVTVPIPIPAPVSVISTRSPDDRIYINSKPVRKAISNITGLSMDEIAKVTPKMIVDGGVTVSKLKLINGLGPSKIMDLKNEIKQHGLELPD